MMDFCLDDISQLIFSRLHFYVNRPDTGICRPLKKEKGVFCEIDSGKNVPSRDRISVEVTFQLDHKYFFRPIDYGLARNLVSCTITEISRIGNVELGYITFCYLRRWRYIRVLATGQQESGQCE